MQPCIYDDIGQDYASLREQDPRWSATILKSLGDAHSVINIGAGAGSYEPVSLDVTALEPSINMIRQRHPDSARVVRGVAEALPFRDNAFDAALAILTTHHWVDPATGFSEMLRVSRRQVIVTWAPEVTAEFWLVRDYLPEIQVREAGLATLDAAMEHLPGARAVPLTVPQDCRDGFLGAYWRRPEVYLDPRARQAISGFALLDQRVVEEAMAQLGADLKSGEWENRNRAILKDDAADLGYRIVVRNGS